MTAKDVIKNSINMCHEVLTTYINDLSDADLMVRSVPGVNHIAWQLGHLVASENHMVGQAGFSMPALPDGFAEAHTPETSSSDDSAKFFKKDEYLACMAEQREGTLAALEAATDADLGKATPEEMHAYAPTVGVAFNVVGIHLMMHAAQFVPVRRKLGKPVTI